MKSNTRRKSPAKLDASLLARKGEAVPAVAATVHNNPSLAWDMTAAPKRASHSRNRSRLGPHSFAKAFANEKSFQPSRQQTKADAVAMIFKIEDQTYLRLKYQSQMSGQSSQDLIRMALEFYLNAAGVPQGSNWLIKPA